MTKEILFRLHNLGINTNQTSLDMFDNLLDLCEFLYEEVEVKEIKRFKRELNRNLKSTN